MDLKTKLNPRRFPNMSPKMAALVGYILGEHWVTPEIVNIQILSDNYVLAQTQDDIGFNHFIGSLEDVENNWVNLLAYAGLTDEETNEANRLYIQKISSHALVG